MTNSHFSFLILTYNEEQHLPRLLNSIDSLHAAVYILDSGSEDETLNIAKRYGATVRQHAFINHPLQWHHALQVFDLQTPWVIGMDADQVLSEELKRRLQRFKDDDYLDIDGIYFNRKNYFKNKWIRHGGLYPFYQLKMFRPAKGYSDLNERMDHRFIVPGKTVIWKDADLIEENLKENSISFWIGKHNVYSDLLAKEEVERRLFLRAQTLKPLFFGSPDQRRAWLKRIWWKMPLFIRPFGYFIYRYIFRMGILDGYQGFLFHFLQAFWFRLMVDVKIKEINDRPESN
jgi:glycosyltransferase involved in cell wall biosynthesis